MQTPMENEFKENVDYVLVPLQDNEDAWGVRFMTGDYVETVLQYNAIAFNEIQDHMTFNFRIVSSPDDDLSETTTGLQEHAGLILEAIIELGLTDGSVMMKERENNVASKS